MNQFPPISVVLCTYNGAAFIEEQLSSILTQTCAIDELIIVDDKSTDDTIAIIKSIREKFSCIQLYENIERLGAIKNFEKALPLAKNELIAVSDQDDIWHPQKLEKLIANFSENSLLIYCNSVRFIEKPDFFTKINSRYLRFQGTDGRKIFIFNSVSGHAMIIRNTLLHHALPFKESVMYDWWMAVIAAYNGGVQYLPEVLVLQRVHNNNVSINDKYDYGTSKYRINYKRMVLPHLQQFINTPGMPDADKMMVQKLFALWKNGLDRKFSPELFFFLMKYRKTLFAFKKKKTAFFTHLKYSWWFSTN